MDAPSDIADLLPGPADPPLSVLFCGVNAPRLTVSTGEFFAQPGNRFWRALYGAGFTPRLLASSEYHELARLGYGITKLVGRSTARADELTANELRAGVPRLTDIASREHPRWIAFLGISAFRIAFRRSGAQLGPQSDLRIADARFWVLPNPSGLNRRWSLSALIAEYEKLHIVKAAQNIDHGTRNSHSSQYEPQTNVHRTPVKLCEIGAACSVEPPHRQPPREPRSKSPADAAPWAPDIPSPEQGQRTDIHG